MSEARSHSDVEKARELIENYDIFGFEQEWRKNPYPFYEATRKIGPIVKEPRYGVYVATRYRDILDIERRSQDFSAAVASIGPFSVGQMPEREDEVKCPFGQADLDPQLTEWRDHTNLSLIPVLTLDPPEHTRFRDLINKLFTPKRKDQLLPRLRFFAHELVDAFIDRGETEWVAGYASPYTYYTMNETMDIPRAPDKDMARRFKEGEMGRRGGGRALVDGSVTRDADPQADPTMLSLDQFANLLRERRANPTDDVLSEIATAKFENDEYPDIEELKGIASVMYGAGQGTTMHWIGTIMYYLAQDQEAQDRLRENPDLIQPYVEEVLRYDPPVQGLFRYARHDTEVGDVRIPAGAVIWMNYAAGNRDPEEFDNPLEMCPERGNAYKGISFGAGRHFCPGQPLAKLEAKTSFEEVLKRMKNIRLKYPADSVEYPEWFVVRGPNSLWIEFDKIE
ncbi:MAG: cytochrome P450 [Gammaproteobacteria bacterium]|jgi:cytochrome P450 family 150 subfamily A5|nr:cytochrome P450 [Gammaproteobacteria bacterium]MBT4493294.1 cytochrome P450 [Gammaproteobacteria bacterium]MBT7371256.1 cytochrome P450 [Gammaproteobacteria bacterium]